MSAKRQAKRAAKQRIKKPRFKALAERAKNRKRKNPEPAPRVGSHETGSRPSEKQPPDATTE